ncbi:MAG: aminotransferase class I/II-fold pyridoxal phosphate-dependent enzyme [Chloroflexi bacterium]|nr:aminotransferase class I/II-fold pyridoxal phosphate-dependent enzyme [Chloroflexota bacterium]
MSRTPGRMAIPTQPSSYAWEATNEAIAERYGVPIERVARFDTNTAPAPPEIVHQILAAGRFVVPVSEYPPGDYGELVRAAAARYGVGTDEILVGAGADEILDLVTKAFLPPGGSAVVPTPTYPMFGVLTDQRPAHLVRVPRRGADEAFAVDANAVRDAARTADLVWLCSPNNPTGRAERTGVIDDLLETIAADAERDHRPAPTVVVDEAYAEFNALSNLELRTAYPRLVLVRTMSKAYGIAGLRVGFAVAQPDVIGLMAPYRPPGSVSVASVTVATRLLQEPGLVSANVARTIAERARLSEALAAEGWAVQPSETNFLLVSFASRERAGEVADGLLQRGLVPRTFGSDHPLSNCLRVTVRNVEQDDRLIEAAREIGG